MEEHLSRLQASRIFLRAAEYIRQYGWQVTGMSQHGAPRCSMGALASAHPDDVWNGDLAVLMFRELNDELGGIGLTEYNYRHNDGEQVALLFERIADRLRLISSQVEPALQSGRRL